MSANFTLTLENPAVTTGPLNTAYTGQGNSLLLKIGNDFGSALTIGGDSSGTHLLIGVSANVMDENGAKALDVSSPWTITSFDEPGGDSPIGEGNYVFYLEPPAKGVPLAEGTSTLATLSSLNLSAIGSGQVTAYYDFDGIASDALDATAPLNVVAAPNPDLPDLFDPSALGFNLYVNGGDEDNPIMVSASPVTSENAVDNVLRLNFAFQAAQSPKAVCSTGLVPSWDASKPPTFRISFPYFSATSGLPSYLDLTDCYKSTDPEYDPLTSAWNIPVSFSPDRQTTDDGFWNIGLDPSAAVPVWMVRPDATNQNLFTAAETSPSEPGPFLDVFVSNIVSGLPIHDDMPQTLMYLQWNDFPGFNDGVAVYTLQKTFLGISLFTVEVVRNESGPELKAKWNTSGENCLFSGASSIQSASATFTTQLSPDAPLQSSYTLTAQSGETKVSKTLNVQWQVNQGIASMIVDGMQVEVTPDGTHLLIPSVQADGLATYDPVSLQQLPFSPITSGAGIETYAIAPNGSAVYYLDGSRSLYGSTLSSRQVTPGSGVNYLSESSPIRITVSADSSKVVMTTLDITANTGQVIVLSSDDLAQISGSPFQLPNPGVGLAVGSQTGRTYVATGLTGGVLVLDGETYQVVANASDCIGALMLAISTDESTLYVLGMDQTANSFYLAKVDAATMQVSNRQLVGYGPLTAAYLISPLAMAALVLSADAGLLFLIGVSLASQQSNEMPVIRFSIYDTATMQEVSWSPLAFSDLVSLDLAMSPDGTRLFVLAFVGLGSPACSLYAVDPVFS